MTHSGPRMLAALGLMAALSGCSALAIVDGLTPDSGYRLESAIAYGGLPRQRLDVYVPIAAGGPYPTVVFFYGGRWTFGNREDYRFVGQALASRGILTVVADYRHYPEVRFPAFVEDGARAVAWTHRKIHEFGGDPDRLFLMGHSAGAHIAAMLATDERYLRREGGGRQWLAGFIGLSGPYDFLPLTDGDLVEIFGPADLQPASQPVNFVDDRAPPMLLMHGLGDDTVRVRNTRNLAARALSSGVPVTTIYYPDLGHVRIIGAMAKPFQGWAPVAKDISEFIHGREKTERVDKRNSCRSTPWRATFESPGAGTTRGLVAHDRGG